MSQPIIPAVGSYLPNYTSGGTVAPANNKSLASYGTPSNPINDTPTDRVNGVSQNPSVPNADGTSFGTPKSEPAVISSQNGKNALQTAIAQHQDKLAQIQNNNPTPVTPTGGKQEKPAETPTMSADQIDNLKTTQHALTFDELNASGYDKNNYVYDQNSTLYLPKDQNVVKGNQITDAASTAAKKISDSFSSLLTYADTATANLISTLQTNLQDQISAQQKINANAEAGINTENIRGGTTRYAGGIAGGMLTAVQNDGLDKIKALQDKTAQSIATAQSALVDKHYSAFMDEQNLQEKLKSDTLTELKNLQDETDKQKQLLFDQQKQADAKVADARDFAEKVREFNKTNSLDWAKLNATINPGGNNNITPTPIVTTGPNGQIVAGYTVQPTDTGGLFQISQTTGVNLDALKAANPQLDANFTVKPGDVIHIPSASDNFLEGKTKSQIDNYNSLPALQKSNVKQLLSGDALLSDLISSRGIQGSAQRQQLLSDAQKIDPSFSENTNKIRYNYKKDWNDATTVIGKTKVAINTALNHLAEVSNLSKQLSPSNIQYINKTANWWDTQTGDPEITNLQFGINQLATEIATAYKGGVPSDSEVKDEKAVLGTQLSKNQFQGVFNTASQFLSGKISSLNYNYKSTMGTNPPQAVIDPVTRQALIDSGIDANKISADPNAPEKSSDAQAIDKINAFNDISPKNAEQYNFLVSQNPTATPTQILQALGLK